MRPAETDRTTEYRTSPYGIGAAIPSRAISLTVGLMICSKGGRQARDRNYQLDGGYIGLLASKILRRVELEKANLREHRGRIVGYSTAIYL